LYDLNKLSAVHVSDYFRYLKTSSRVKLMKCLKTMISRWK